MSDDVPSPGDPQFARESAGAAWPRWSSRLHDSLESQESVAAELRRAVEELRRTLDEPPPSASPVPPSASPRLIARYRSRRFPPALPGLHRIPRDRSRRHRMWLLLPAGAAVVLTVAGLVVASARPDTPPRSASTQAQGAPAPPPPPLPPWPGRTTPEPPDLPTRGAGADAKGTAMVVAFSADRTVDVYERAVLSPGRTTFTLRPADVSALLRPLEATPPTVQDLRAEVDGRPVPVATTSSGWTLAAPPGTAGTRLVLRYRLTGAMSRKQPAPPGRFVLVLAPLAPSAGGAGDAVVVRIRDRRVEDVYCPGAPHPLCGSADGALHTGTVPNGAVPVVVALVTFPS